MTTRARRSRRPGREGPHRVVCDVREWVDLYQVQRSVLETAAAVGFDRRGCGELAIVGSELASNILKYGVRGCIDVAAVEDAAGRGIGLVASDQGPQFHDLESAVRDGWDDRGPIDPLQMLKRRGIGGGLGAILRFSHSFEVKPDTKGKKIHVTRYLVAPRRSKPPRFY